MKNEKIKDLKKSTKKQKGARSKKQIQFERDEHRARKYKQWLGREDD